MSLRRIMVIEMIETVQNLNKFWWIDRQNNFSFLLIFTIDYT
jgi:hypothetical protein